MKQYPTDLVKIYEYARILQNKLHIM